MSSLDANKAIKLRQALTATADELFALLQDTDGEVLRATLKNPRLAEEHLLTLLRRRDLPEDLIKALYQHKHSADSHRLKLALAQNPATPGHLMQTLLPQLFTFELLNLCVLPGTTSDQKLAAERVIVQRLPTTPLGQKMTLARRGTTLIVGELLKEGDTRLLDACLTNPRLKEAAIFQFLNGAKATAETISCVARHPRWKNRPNLQMAIMKNRKTPSIWYTVLLPRLRPTEIQQLLANPNLSPAQRALVQEELRRRPKR